MHATSTTRTYVYSLGIIWASIMAALAALGWTKTYHSYKKAGLVVHMYFGSTPFSIGMYCLLGFAAVSMLYFSASMIALCVSRRSFLNTVRMDIIVLSILVVWGLGSTLYITVYLPQAVNLMKLLGVYSGRHDMYSKYDFALLTGLRMLLIATLLGWWMVVNIVGVLIVIVLGTKQRSTMFAGVNVWSKTSYELTEMSDEYVEPGMLPRGMLLSSSRAKAASTQSYMAVNPDSMFQVPVEDTQLDQDGRRSIAGYDTPAFERAQSMYSERDSVFRPDSRVSSYNTPFENESGPETSRLLEEQPLQPLPMPMPMPTPRSSSPAFERAQAKAVEAEAETERNRQRQREQAPLADAPPYERVQGEI